MRQLVRQVKWTRFIVGLSVILEACASKIHHPNNGMRATQLPAITVTASEALGIEQRFIHAETLESVGDHAAAAEEFEAVYRLNPDGHFAPFALFRAAANRDANRQTEQALERYQQVVRRFSEAPLARDAGLRAVRLLVYLDHWEEAGALAEVLESHLPSFTPDGQVAIWSALALARLSVGEVDKARSYVEKGRNVVDQHGLDRAGSVSRDLAQLFFALGEIKRLEAERIGFQPIPKDFPVQLEARCQALLDAQSAYSDAMRAYDTHWSVMAGLRVGELYQKLHQELMQVPFPTTADTEGRRNLFEGAMRLRYEVLLEKALAMIEHTLSLASRVDEHSTWVTQVQRTKEAIGATMEAEKIALQKLPFSRAELNEAFILLSKKKSGRLKR